MAKHLYDIPSAFCDLNEALNLAISGGYRVHEADIRIAMAWANLLAEDILAAKKEAETTKNMSTQMGYYWGIMDADEVLSALNQVSSK
jgi:hypothetical protein